MAENPMTEKEFKMMRSFIKPFSGLNVFVYKLTGGRLMGKFQGRPVVLIEMTGAKSGVCWSSPACPVCVQGTGFHETEAAVLAREDISPEEELKAGALSMSCPWMVRNVAPEFVSSTWN